MLTIPFKNKHNQNLSLHSGAANGNLGLVKFALDNGQPIESFVNNTLAIHLASGNGHIQVVSYLLERGCSVDARKLPRRISDTLLVRESGNGSTALHYAAANGHLAIVKLLLEKGAHPNLTDKFGSTPFEVAFAKKHYDSATLILKATLELAKAEVLNRNHSTTENTKNQLPLEKLESLSSVKAKSKPSLNLKKIFQRHDRHTEISACHPSLILQTPPSPALC